MVSGITNFHGVTGGVYKAQKHIHRRIADRRLLAIPASCRRVAIDNPNIGAIFKKISLRDYIPQISCDLATYCFRHSSTPVAQDVRGMLT